MLECLKQALLSNIEVVHFHVKLGHEVQTRRVTFFLFEGEFNLSFFEVSLTSLAKVMD